MTLCDTETGGKILCIRLSALGDLVHCMNALTLLRRSRPAAHITWVAEGRVAGLIGKHPYIDDLLIIPRVDWGQALKDPWRWAEVWPEIVELTSGLRKTRYDISIDFQSSLKSSWLVAAAGAAVRAGFAPPVSREFNHLFQNRLVTVPSDDCHRIERYLALLAPIGISTEYAPACLPCANEHRRVAEEICRDSKRPLIVIHPGASAFAEFKRWLPERYGELALRLIREIGASVLVTFGPGEEALAHRVTAAAKHETRLAPRLPHLQQLTALLQMADLFIGGDTGPMHIASALDRPVVAVFGPKNPASTGPSSDAAEVVRANVPCSPCTRRECPDPACMEQIGVDQVYAAACRVLEKASAKRSAPSHRTIGHPFYSDFQLGNWKGKIRTSLSSPGLYRRLAMVAVSEDSRISEARLSARKEQMNSSPSTDIECRIDDTPLKLHSVFRHRRCGKILRKLTGDGPPTLAQYWKTAVMMYARNIACLMPLCLMQRSEFPVSSEILIFNSNETELADILIPEEHRHARNILAQLAETIRLFHENGFHHRSLSMRDIAMQGPHMVVRSLDRVTYRTLPPFLRELCWGLQLRGLYRDTRKHFTAREFGEMFLIPYCRNLPAGIIFKRLLARTIHPELDDPPLWKNTMKRKDTDYVSVSYNDGKGHVRRRNGSAGNRP